MTAFLCGHKSLADAAKMSTGYILEEVMVVLMMVGMVVLGMMVIGEDGGIGNDGDW